MYKLHPSKSLKKLNEENSKITHIFPQCNSQFSKNLSVNLSKLGTYKGKFSLASKYNSISSHNNNESKYHSQQNQIKGQFMSEANKENIAGMSNIMTGDYSQERDGIFRKKSKFIKTQPDNHEKQESQNMQKILMVANSFNFQNQLLKSDPPTQLFSTEHRNTFNNKKSIPSKQEFVTKDKKKISDNNPFAQRRSKFHKYDNSTDDNEFLVIEQEIRPNIAIKKSVQKKFQNRETLPKNLTKKSHPHQIHTQTIRLSELQVQKDFQNLEKQLESYQQSIKHITYSMIKMISLIGKIQIHQVSNTIENRNIKIMSQIKSEIFTIYSKELGKYIDKLKIRDQLKQMAQKEQEFIKQQSLSTISQHESAMTTSKHHRRQQADHRSSNSSCNDQSISHQKHSYLQSSTDSLLKEYEIKEDSENGNFQNADSLDEEEERLEASNFFDFDSIKEFEIMPSGRNLLETFNNQHLCHELEKISREVIKHQEAQGEQEDIRLDQNFNKRNEINQSSVLDNERIQIYEQNLINALNQVKIESPQVMDENCQPKNICRKLFDQNQSSFKHRTLSAIIMLQNHNQSSHNQTISETLQPQHYYEVISTPQSHQGSTNYLKLDKGDKIKLLRKVDHNRWIAEFEDSIGFIQQGNIVRRLKCLGLTAQKDLSNPIR